MDFHLFIVVTGLLFVRPIFFHPALTAPFYEVAIIACFLASFSTVLAQFSTASLVSRPISAGVIGMLAATFLSHLVHGSIEGGVTQSFEFAKVLIYYVLLVGTVNTPDRLRRFLVWFVVFVMIVAGLALLQYHGMINLPSFAPLEAVESDPMTGGNITIFRLRGGDSGTLDDPNYLCLVLVASMMICLNGLTDRRRAMVLRGAWLVPLALAAHAFVLTRSRGGFLMLMSALLVLFHARYGWRKMVLLMGIAAPLAFRYGGRQADISADAGSGQQRVQMWSEGQIAFFREPIFGIGQGNFEEQLIRAAHNSYIQCYTELGFFGGTIFLGMFLCAIATLYRLGRDPAAVPDAELRRLNPFLLAAVVGWAAGIMTLSCSYIVPTYIILGLAASFAAVAPKAGAEPPQRLDALLVVRTALASLAFVIVMRVYVVYALHY